MKITKIYVSGFGKLVSKEYDLNDFTQIHSLNGEGKTTLANFIEVMFYGIDSKRSSQRSYFPWNSATFGGYICFTYEGKNYKVQRLFGKRRADDEFTIFNDKGEPCSDFGENIGEEIFGVDRNAFKRMCFFTDADFKEGETTIKDKLESVITDAKNVGGFSQIEKDFNERIKEYENKQHNGKIPTVLAKITEINVEKSRYLSAPSEYERLKAELDEKESERKVLAEKLTLIQKDYEEKLKSSSLNNDSALRILSEQANDSKEKLKEAHLKLNGYTVEEETVQSYLEKNRLNLKKSERLTLLNEKKQELLQQKINLPDERTVEDIKADQQNLTNKKLHIIPIFFIVLTLVCSLLFLVNIPKVATVCLITAFAFMAGFSFIYTAKADKKAKNAIKAKVKDFLAYYANGVNDFDFALRQIEQERKKENDRQRLLTETDEEILSIKKDLYAYKVDIESFLEKFNLPYSTYGEKLNGLLLAVYTIKEESLAIEKLEKEKNKLLLDEKAVSSKAQLATVSAEREKLLGEQAELDKRITDVKNLLAVNATSCERLEKLNEQEQRLEDELSVLKREREILIETLSCLKEAKQNLTEGCLKPLSSTLEKYASILLPSYAKQLKIDEDLNVSCEINGVVRDYSSFSLGQQTLIDFALRLGFINAVFKGELPFIIIDDAFSPLDENNFSLVKKLMEEVSKNIQVIYFTPHKSRLFVK